MKSDNPYSPPATPLTATDAEPPVTPVEAEKLGGWLILVAIGIIFSPVRIVFQLVPIYSNLISDGSWAALTTPGTGAYHPLWIAILVGEIIVNAALFCGWIFIAVQFFAKKKRLPKLYISILLSTIAIQLGDAWAISLVRPNDPIFDPETVRELGRSLVAACIWIPYMLVSTRVKATFVR